MKKLFLSVVFFLILHGYSFCQYFFQRVFPRYFRLGREDAGSARIIQARKNPFLPNRGIFIEIVINGYLYLSQWGVSCLKKCPMPLGTKMVHGNVMVLMVKKVQGFLMFYTYKPSQKEGKITV